MVLFFMLFRYASEQSQIDVTRIQFVKNKKGKNGGKMAYNTHRELGSKFHPNKRAVVVLGAKLD